MNPEAVLKVAVSALLGAGIGWAANALTLSGRVDAIERGQARIEAQLDRLIELKAPGAQANNGAGR